MRLGLLGTPRSSRRPVPGAAAHFWHEDVDAVTHSAILEVASRRGEGLENSFPVLLDVPQRVIMRLSYLVTAEDDDRRLEVGQTLW